MDKLKSFKDFELLESQKPSLGQALVGVLTGDKNLVKPYLQDLKLLGKAFGFGGDGSGDAGSGGNKPPTSPTNSKRSKIGRVTMVDVEDVNLETPEIPNREENIELPETKPYTKPPTDGVGSDDFMLYMQHQQGVAGATGIIRASLGRGNMHPATVKHRNGKKYAYLTGNVPSDRPKMKADIIKALDAGDQRTAGKIFLEMWREKWHTLGIKALSEINSKSEIKKVIERYCQKYGVPFDFAVKVAYIESRFNPNAGNKNYKGLFALSKDGFNKYSPGGNIFDPKANANAGVATLRDNIRSFIKTMGQTITYVDISPWAKQLA